VTAAFNAVAGLATTGRIRGPTDGAAGIPTAALSALVTGVNEGIFAATLFAKRGIAVLASALVTAFFATGPANLAAAPPASLAKIGKTILLYTSIFASDAVKSSHWFYHHWWFFHLRSRFARLFSFQELLHDITYVHL